MPFKDYRRPGQARESRNQGHTKLQSVLIVNTPATSSDLTILSNVKAELGLTITAEDANIETWIDQASAACAAYCNRVFGLETVTETYRNRFNFIYRHEGAIEKIILVRVPVVSVISIVEDGTALVQDVDYELDPEEGILYRLDPSSDSLIRWSFNKLTINYSGGYLLIGSLPFNIERACITQVKAIRGNAARDPQVKSETIPGVLTTAYWSAGANENGALEPEVTSLLDPYRNVSV